MKPRLIISLAGALALLPVGAFAQYSPGSPDGVLQLQQGFQLQQHPQMEFAASAPDPKYQHGTSQRRRKADNGDTSGDACNLQCSPENY
jgi:hypothetical protein